MEMNELEAWKFLAERFKGPIKANSYNEEGICLGLARLATEPLITEFTYKVMKGRTNSVPGDMDPRTYNCSELWYPVTREGHDKRVAWIEKQIAELEQQTTLPEGTVQQP
jgi:hypothetical protein